MEKELGIIESTQLGFGDHGIFTFCINFDFGSSGQGFGGIGLNDYDKEKKKRIGSVFGGTVIMRILEAVGVEWWDDLIGKEMWVYRDRMKIHGIEAPKYRKGGGKFMIQDLIDECRISDETGDKDE